MTTAATSPETETSGAQPARKALDAAFVGRVNAAAMKAIGDNEARRKWGDSKSGSPVTTNALCAEIARLNLALEDAINGASLGDGAGAERDPHKTLIFEPHNLAGMTPAEAFGGDAGDETTFPLGYISAAFPYPIFELSAMCEKSLVEQRTIAMKLVRAYNMHDDLLAAMQGLLRVCPAERGGLKLAEYEAVRALIARAKGGAS